MKTITTNKNTLLNIVATVAKFMPKEGEFTDKMVLAGNDGMLEVKAFNYTQTIIYKNIKFVSSDITDTSFSPLSIDGKKLLTVLKAAKTDDVQIELHTEKIVIKSARSKVKIDTLAEIQDIEIIIKKSINFDLSSFVGLMQQTLHSINVNEPRFALTGAALQVENGTLNIASTDTRRLSYVSADTNAEDFKVIVPKDAISTISKLFNGFEVEANISDTHLSVHTNMVSYQTTLISDAFIEWQRIIPKEIAQKILINKNFLTELVKEASIFNKDISIEISNGEIQLKDLEGNTEITEAFSDTEANILFGIDAKYLLDFLHSSTEENIEIGFNEDMMPIVFTANASFSEIIMPIAVLFENETTTEVQHAA